MKRRWMGYLVIIAVAMMSSCSSGPKNDSAQDVTSRRDASRIAISYADQPHGQLTVNNRRNERLVLFAGSIKNSKILGGIEPNDERSFELKGIIPNGNGVFVLRAVKETDYRQNGTEPDDEIFSQMVVYDSDDKDSEFRVTIDKSTGGGDQVIFQNNTTYVVEISVDGLDGPKVATLQRGERRKIVQMEPRRAGYTFYPVYLGYSQKEKQIVKVSPQDMNDGKWVIPMPEGDPEVPKIPFDPPGSLADLTSPVAYISLKNGLAGGIQLTYGRNPILTQTGFEGVNPGKTGVFELKVAATGSSVWDGLELDRNTGGSNSRIKIEPITVKAGYTYELVLNSDGQYRLDRDGKPKSASELAREFELKYLLD